MIDERLLDCDTQPEVEENFNRVMEYIDEGGGGGGGDCIRTISRFSNGSEQLCYDTLNKPITVNDNVTGIVFNNIATGTKSAVAVSFYQQNTIISDGSYYYYVDRGIKVILPEGNVIVTAVHYYDCYSGEDTLMFDEVGHVIYREEQPPT